MYEHTNLGIMYEHTNGDALAHKNIAFKKFGFCCSG